MTVNLRPLSSILLACAVALAAPLAAADRVMVLIDNSGSMRSNDADRLVPEAVSGFIRSLPAETDVGVIAFDGRARLVQAPIAAGDFSSSALDGIDYSGQLTDPSVAVERALYEFRQLGPAAGSVQSVILLTDGMIDLGNPAASLRAEDWLVGELSDSLQQQGARVWAIALTEAADFRMLSRLTAATGGEYFRAAEASEVAAAIGRIEAGIASVRSGTDGTASTAGRADEQRLSGSAGSGEAAIGGTALAGSPDTATADERRAAAGSAAGNAVSGSSSAAAAEPTPARGAAPALSAPEPGNLRWWLAFALLASGILMLAWVSYSTWRSRRSERTEAEPALEYFPECYLVDLQGVTEKPTHMLSSKYNMITRLQNPPADGINYIQVFRRQIGRRHALIEYRDFSFWVIDQNSVNGTFLNGERLAEETRLKHGDRLRFHSFEFEFCVSDLALSNETLIDRERASA